MSGSAATPSRSWHGSSKSRRSRSSSRPVSGWSDAQRFSVYTACKQAGWNSEQRHLAMKHVGCPVDSKLGRCTTKHARLTNTQFELLMELAEACAAQRGTAVKPPREVRSWRELVGKQGLPLMRKAETIAREAHERQPKVFGPKLLDGMIERVTMHDLGEFAAPACSLQECDAGQLRRVVEALKQYVGREFARRGLTPGSFEIPPSVLARVKREREAATRK
ncbi:MAG: hypothetical protein AAF747_11985 [Planctomycetota bacterium]